MADSLVWPSGLENVAPETYVIPEIGEFNWGKLRDFLVALAKGAQSTTFQKQGIRVATTSPITISSNDCNILVKLEVPGAVSATLPIGTAKQIITIVDSTGDAATNAITITPSGADTIEGNGSHVISSSGEALTFVYDATNTDWKLISISRPNMTADLIAGLVADRALISDGSGVLSNSAVTATELSYLANASSEIQTQLNDLLALITLNDTDIATLSTSKQNLDGDLTALSALASTGVLVRSGVESYVTRSLSAGSSKITISNADGVAGNPTINADESAFTLNNISGTLATTKGGTGSTNPLANNRVMISGGGVIVESDLIAPSRVLVSSATGLPIASSITTTEIAYLSGVSSAIQSQLDAKQAATLTTKGDLLGYGPALTRVPVGADDLYLKSDSSEAVGWKWSTVSATVPDASPSQTGSVNQTSQSFAGLKTFNDGLKVNSAATPLTYYEEGTWTMTNFQNAAGTNVSAATGGTCTWQRYNDLVIAYGEVKGIKTNSSGDLIFVISHTGLPGYTNSTFPRGIGSSTIARSNFPSASSVCVIDNSGGDTTMAVFIDNKVGTNYDINELYFHIKYIIGVGS